MLIRKCLKTGANKFKLLLIIVFVGCTSMQSFSQNIELYGGLTRNDFYDFSPGYESKYTSDLGYFFELGIEYISVDWLRLRLTLGYDKYGGNVEAIEGSPGGYKNIDFTIDKSIISFGIFPVNIKIINEINFNFGIKTSHLINESFQGTTSGWSMPGSSWSYDLEDTYDRYSSKTYFGFQGRIAYDYYLTDKVCIFPQYQFYFGTSSEFDKFPGETKSMRHYFGIGIQRKIK